MTQHTKPDKAASFVLALVWSIFGLIAALMYAAVLFLMSSGGVSTPDDLRAVPLIMSLTLTPLIIGFGWIPVVWTRHKGDPSSVNRVATIVLAGSGAMIVLNTLLLPVSMMVSI